MRIHTAEAVTGTGMTGLGRQQITADRPAEVFCNPLALLVAPAEVGLAVCVTLGRRPFEPVSGLVSVFSNTDAPVVHLANLILGPG